VTNDEAIALTISTYDSFEDLYREHYPRLTRALAIAGAGDAAEDLAQEAMARTLASWRRVRHGANPPGYVYITGFRLLQRHQRRTRTTDSTRVPNVAGPEGVATTNLVLAQTLDAMPPGRRVVAALCISLGWTTDEAATALRISPSTARVQLHRARMDLRQALGETEPADTPG